MTLSFSSSKDLVTHCNAIVGSILVTSVSTLINFVLPLVTPSLSTTWKLPRRNITCLNSNCDSLFQYKLTQLGYYQDGTLHSVSFYKTGIVWRWNITIGLVTHYEFLEVYKKQFLKFKLGWYHDGTLHYVSTYQNSSHCTPGQFIVQVYTGQKSYQDRTYTSIWAAHKNFRIACSYLIHVWF